MVFTLVNKGFIRNETSATIARLLTLHGRFDVVELGVVLRGSIVAFGGAPR